MLTPKEAGKKLFVGAATIRNYIRNGVIALKPIILHQDWSVDEENKTGWEGDGWGEPQGYILDEILEYDKFYNPIKASFTCKEKLKAITVNVGRRKEYRISLQDLEDFKNKWLV